jgi:MSHA biogenesis protein MshJ
MSSKLTATAAALGKRFDSLSLRERALVVVAVLAIAITTWNGAFMTGLTLRERGLSDEVTQLEASLAATSSATQKLVTTDPTTQAMAQLNERQAALEAINAKLASESAGLIPPAQMVEVIHDVLKHQQGVKLVSLQNLPVTGLLPEARQEEPSPTDAVPASATPSASTDGRGPYLHPVELVVEGQYADIVSYLHALEALPWHFYWSVLELETKGYPLNRVRIELSTVSLDKEWIGV